MDKKELLKNTILSLDSDSYFEFKTYFFKEFFGFKFLDDSEVTQGIFAEKLYDYFEKVELSNNKDFSTLLQKYMQSLDDKVSKYIEKSPRKKNAEIKDIPRARKYYNKIIEYKKQNNIDYNRLRDYSRIMFCLYVEIINRNDIITNFDYSVSSLKSSKLIQSMKESETLKNNVTKNILEKKNELFGQNKEFSFEMCSRVIAIIVLFEIINRNIDGE
ncbi:hypothetical protein [uncultured Streptococcus sp.]|uniref:hypothetical protein n=1 Tax=uncultured Streptococcus sp. TaxID=83427 RepID=UPI0025901FD3|nr:hypothetical protein [uncultured Streptococcus sp.]